MKINKIKFYVYLLIYSQIKHTKLMTKNMRSPSDGFLGNIAKHLMINFNEFIINDSVKKLDVRNNDEVIEIGSGNGQAIEKILQLTNKIKYLNEYNFLVIKLDGNTKNNNFASIFHKI